MGAFQTFIAGRSLPPDLAAQLGDQTRAYMNGQPPPPLPPPPMPVAASANGASVPATLLPPPPMPAPPQAPPAEAMVPQTPHMGLGQLGLLLLAGGVRGVATGLIGQHQMDLQRQRTIAIANALPEDLRTAYIADPENFMKEYAKNFAPVTAAEGSTTRMGNGKTWTAPKEALDNGRVGTWTPDGYQELGNTGPSIKSENGLIIDQRGINSPDGVVGTYSTPQKVVMGERPGSFTPSVSGLPTPPGGLVAGPSAAPSPIGAPLVGPVADMIRQRAAAAGLGDQDQAALVGMARLESNLGRNTKSGNSSTGLFQFHPDTFAQLGGKDINDPIQQTDAAIHLYKQNAASLSSAGIPVTPTSLYMAHQQGIAGAKALYSADPNLSAVQAILPIYASKYGDQKGLQIARKAIVGNGGSADMTAGQFLGRWGGRVLVAQAGAQGGAGQGQRAPQAAPQAPQAQPGAPANPPGWDVGPDPMAAGGPNSDLTGEAYLKTLPAGYAATVRQMATGNVPMPSGFVMKTPYGQKLMNDIMQFDPTANSINLPARLATRKAFTSGPQQRNLANLNTVVNHLSSLHDSIAGLRNFSGAGTGLNGISNAVYGMTDPAYQRARAKFDGARSIVSADLVSALTGGGGGLHDREDWQKQFDPDASPDKLYAGVQQAAEMINSRVDPMREAYQQGMGTTEDPFQVMFPKAAANLERLRSAAAAGEAPKAAAPAPVGEGSVATGPDGHQIVLKGGAWRDARTGAVVH